MPPMEGKKCRSLPPDVLSNLPDNVIDLILMRLPSKDVVRTSVLSKKWKYHWCRLTRLKLDRSVWRTPKDLLYPTVKFTKIIYQILTHHEGPITKFMLDIPHLERCLEIGNFLYFLSRNGIQHLVLNLPQAELYRLPSSLFTCSQLQHLNLRSCIVHPPLDFKGFDRLIRLELCRVTISSELLGCLISLCPLLELLVLHELSKTSDTIEINAPKLRFFDFTGRITSICLKNVPRLTKLSLKDRGFSYEAENFDYAKFFVSCSALEHLLLKFGPTELYADEAPTRLRYDLSRVKRVYLYGIVLMESCKLSCALCLIRSFPILEYLEYEVSTKVGFDDNGGGVIESLELERFSDVTFSHLREVTIQNFKRTTAVMQLIKLLLAKSPVLVRILIYPSSYHDESLRTQSKILAEISTFCRASAEAEVVYNHDC